MQRVNLDGILAQLRYNNQARYAIKHDAEAVLNTMHSIQVKIGDLGPSTLLQLYGTIPIFYKGAQYNIPIAIWMVEAYPISPPKCFVTPTPDMRIKDRHKHVDQAGLIYLPYLHEWQAGKSNVLELISFMSSAFGDSPPVYKYEPPRQAPVAMPPPSYHDNPVKDAPVNEAAAKKDRLQKQVEEKIKQYLKTEYASTAKDIENLFKLSRELTAGRTTVETGTQALQREYETSVAHVQNLKQQIEKMAAWLSENEAKDQASIVESVKPIDRWSEQLFEAVANDYAIDDTVYALDKALADGVVDLSTYLKHVRRLAREQFQERALALKVADEISNQRRRR